MVDLVLDDLCRPTGEGFDVGLHGPILPLHFDLPEPAGRALPGEGQAALLCRVGALAAENDRVEHFAQRSVVIEHDDGFGFADHIGGHSNAVVFVGFQRVEQVVGDGSVGRAGGLGFARQEQNVGYNGADHIGNSFFQYGFYGRF